MQHVHMTRLLCMTATIVVMSGCSRVQFAYNQLDWLLPYYIETYIDLNEEQSGFLDQRVEALLTWHCSTHLHAYAELMRSANHDFQTGNTSPETLLGHNTRIEEFWEEILLQASPSIAELLLDADQAQLDELFNGFQKRNKEWLTEFSELTPEEIRRDNEKHMAKELKRWFGPLRSSQKSAVQEWSINFTPLGLAGLSMRERWQRRLYQLTLEADNEEIFLAQFREMIVNPEKHRSPEYQQRLDHNRDETIRLIHTVANSLTQRQKDHVNRKVISIAGDFDDLTCKPDISAASARYTVSEQEYLSINAGTGQTANNQDRSYIPDH